MTAFRGICYNVWVPPLPAVPAVLKVAFIFSDGANTDIVSRFYMHYAGAAPDAAALNGACSLWFDDWGSTLAHATHSSMTLGRVHAIDLSSPTSAEGDFLGASPGLLTGHQLPADVCQVCSYEISRHYRGGHPRGYWPMNQAEDLDTPQVWSSSVVAGNQTQFANFFAAIAGHVWAGGGPLSQVNVSYFHGFTVVTSPTTGRARNVPTVRAVPVVDAVTARVARAHIGTQRRRLQY